VQDDTSVHLERCHCVDASTLASQVLREAGRHQAALLALQGVLAAAPATPGLLPRLQAAATLAMQCPRRGTTSHTQVLILPRHCSGSWLWPYSLLQGIMVWSGHISETQDSCHALQAAGMAPSSGACAVLCIEPGADPAAVRSAYRRQAARWHPDRWAAAAASEEREHAAAQFLAVQRAYEALGGKQSYSI
jgi:DnaJ-domain-containing protein 1